MKFAEIFKLSMNSLTHRGLRSWLTILGIIVGVAAVIAMLSISEGMSQSMESQMSGFGADIVTVSAGMTRASGPESSFGDRFQPGSGGSPPGTFEEMTETDTPILTDADILTISTAEGVDTVSGIISSRATVQYLAQTVTVSVEGIDPDAWNTMTTSELASGRFLELGDGTSVLIGNGVANGMFDYNLTENMQIRVGSKTFIIVGILDESALVVLVEMIEQYL